MAKSKTSIMAELETLQISYDETSSATELEKLLDDAKTKRSPDKQPEQVAPERAKAKVKEVRLGLSTIQDHEERITALEAR